jgi:hypothetical protein
MILTEVLAALGVVVIIVVARGTVSDPNALGYRREKRRPTLHS